MTFVFREFNQLILIESEVTKNCQLAFGIAEKDTELSIIVFVFREFNQLIESEVSKNCQLAFGVAEKELGVSPVMSGDDMASSAVPDKLTIIAYLSKLFQIFKSEPLPTSESFFIYCCHMYFEVRRSKM